MIPKSLGIIPDGNRRLARRLMKEPWKGHEMGISKLYKVLDWCSEIGIRNISFYSLSLENLNTRPKEELDFLFMLAEKELGSILTDKSHFVHRNNTRMLFFGRIDLLPEDLQEKIKQVSEATKNYKGHTLSIAIAYGGRQEIIEAAKRTAKKLNSGEISEINEKSFSQNLYTNGFGDPDLIIRTGGEKRLSNFLLFQSAYSELAFIDSFWPELTKEEFSRIISDFSQRERRFGK